MEPITGLVAGGLAIIAMILFLKVMNLSGDLAKTREDAERTQRELRKVAGQLESNRSKYQEKAQEASKRATEPKTKSSVSLSSPMNSRVPSPRPTNSKTN